MVDLATLTDRIDATVAEVEGLIAALDPSDEYSRGYLGAVLDMLRGTRRQAGKIVEGERREPA